MRLNKEQTAKAHAQANKHAAWKEKARISILAEQYTPGIFNAMLSHQHTGTDFKAVARQARKAAEALAVVIIDQRVGRPE